MGRDVIAHHLRKTMKQITLYSRNFCGWCIDAKEYLKAHQLPYKEVDVGVDAAANAEMIRLSGQKYVPTIVVDGHVLANFDTDQLVEFLKKIG